MYEGLQYIDVDIADFKTRLARIYMREVHRLQVFDFRGLTNLIVKGLSTRILMEHRDAQGQSVFTSQARRRLFDIRGPLVHELILEFFNMFRFGEAVLDLDTDRALQFLLGRVRRRMSWREFILALGLHSAEEMQIVGLVYIRPIARDGWGFDIAGRSQTHEKVTVTDLFYLRGMDVGSVNAHIRHIFLDGYGVLVVRTAWKGYTSPPLELRSNKFIKLEYGVLPSFGYGVFDLVSLVVFGKCRHRYAISSLMDTAYLLSEQPRLRFDRLVSRAKVIENQVIAISVILVSSDSSEDSVGTPARRVILFDTIPTTIPDTTQVITPPTTHTDTTMIPIETPIIAPTIPLSPDYTPASPDYSPAFEIESDSSEDTSSGHIPPLPDVLPFLSSDDDTTDNSISRHSLSDHSSLDLLSTFARPSRKRRTSPMTCVVLPPVFGALSHVRADLIPSPMRVRDIGYLPYVEVGPRKTRVDRVTHLAMPEDIPEPTQEGAVEVTYETLEDLVQRFHDHTQAILVHCVQVIEGVQREQGHRIVGVESAVTDLTERVAELERDNMRLRDTASVQSQRVDQLQRGMSRMQREMRQMRRFQFYDQKRVGRLEACARKHMGYHPYICSLVLQKMPNTRSRASMTHDEVEELIARRVAEEMEAREAARNLETLNENRDEQEWEKVRGNPEWRLAKH
uniref:Uncharacterized protein n=1 Tax=Tanacetum cinerariifolium TaxID=118510 RepID=A0A6L2LN32_TANCI|nr:hypothetical protein [Tanacetum cinerariifolium]